jgi:hypothetical protein
LDNPAELLKAESGDEVFIYSDIGW